MQDLSFAFYDTMVVFDHIRKVVIAVSLADTKQGHLDEARAQAEEIANDLPENKTMPVDANKEIIALIAYLQRLGKDIKAVGAH